MPSRHTTTRSSSSSARTRSSRSRCSSRCSSGTTGRSASRRSTHCGSGTSPCPTPTLPPDMRAAVLRLCGSPPEFGTTAAPERGAGVTLVAVTAAPITPLDVLCASGTSYFGAPAVPYVPGVQGVGTVVASDVHAPGARVWFPTVAGMSRGDGSMAEQCLVPDADVVVLAEGGVADDHVAALGLSAVAAWAALTRAAGLEAGEQVLVLGGGGIVGQVAIQA